MTDLRGMGARIGVVVGALLTLSACAEETTEPDPFTCEAVADGQSLGGVATVDSINVVAEIQSSNGSFVDAPAITDVSSGDLGAVFVLKGVVRVPITDVAGNTVTFSLDGQLKGPNGGGCPVARDFTVTIDGDEATLD